MGGIDRKKVREAFGQRAVSYDANAVVQKRVIERSLRFLAERALSPRRLLDVGSGTGMLAEQLVRFYPDTFIVCADLAFGMATTAQERLGGKRAACLTADAEQLPFAAGAFDLVLSTSTYQWLHTLDAAFAEAFRVLAPGGIFSFALFGRDTLPELKSAYRQALANGEGEDRTHTSFTVDEVRDALARAGFGDIVVTADHEEEIHPDVPELLRSLRLIGAGSASPVPGRGLAGRRVMVEMMEIYRQQHGREEGIPATYEVIYGMGRTG